MKRTEWKVTAVLLVCMIMMMGFANGAESGDTDKGVQGEIRLRYDFIEVNGDRGRFREDNWMTDQSTGGLDWLSLQSTEVAEGDYEWELEGSALYDYQYDLKFLMKKDSHYFKVDFRSFRRYYDGSNEFWDEGAYALPAGSGGFGSIGGTSEHDDSDFYVDRRYYTVEYGITPDEGPEWTFGWHRMEKDGTEVLARGAQTKNAGVANFRGVPAIASMNGTTDTIYGEVAQTFDDKYNFRIRQEYENYRDNQLIEFPRYSAGALDQYRSFHDDPGYINWRTLLMFDSFLDEETYVTANYMYNYLTNDTDRDSIRPNLGNPNHFVNNKHDSSRKSNVGAFGYSKSNVWDIEKLSFSAGLRAEDSSTTSRSTGISSGGVAVNPIDAISGLDEVRVEETLRLVYKGLEDTTLSFDADLEQRYLDWNERENVTAMEIGDVAHAADREGTAGDTGDVGYMEREADIDHIDQVYTWKAVHRFSRAVKGTAKFRYKDLERSYTELFDSDPDYYPGIIGNYRLTGNDLTLKTDFRLNGTTNATLLYQFVQESINTQVGGKTSNFETHRGAGTLALIPMQNMFVVGTFMLENTSLDTPAAGGASTNNGVGTSPYDYKGNSYSLLLDTTYAFNKRTSCTVGFRHTQALGTVDFAGDYVFDKASVTLKHKFASNQTMGLGYQFYDFDNKASGSSNFDDYTASGLFATYGVTF